MDEVIILLWIHIALALLVFIDSLINYVLMRKVLMQDHAVPWSFFFYMLWALLQFVHGFYRIFIFTPTGAPNSAEHVFILTVGTLLQWLASSNMKKVLRA